MEEKTSRIKTAGYENIYIDCPYCKKENIINRISDLPDNLPVSGRYIVCEHCNTQFWTSGDRVSNGIWHWLIDELPIFKERKEYRAYILNLCQGCECFFQQAIVNKLVDRNTDVIDEEGHIDTEKWNNLRKDLDEEKICVLYGKSGEKLKTKFKKASLNHLRKIFLYQFQVEKDSYIPKRTKLKEDKRDKCFSCIEETKINEIRNKVVHKQAYCPTKTEIESFEKLVKSLYWLSLYLDVNESFFMIKNQTHFNLKP